MINASASNFSPYLAKVIKTSVSFQFWWLFSEECYWSIGIWSNMIGWHNWWSFCCDETSGISREMVKNYEYCHHMSVFWVTKWWMNVLLGFCWYSFSCDGIFKLSNCVSQNNNCGQLHTFGSRHWKYFRVVKQDNGNTPIWSESGVGSITITLNGDFHSEDSARDDVGVVVMIS